MADLNLASENFLQAGNNFGGNIGATAFGKGVGECEAAGGGHADDDFVDAIFFDEFDELFATANNAGVADDGTNFAGIVVDKTDDVVVAAGLQFSAEHDAGAAGAIEKHALGRMLTGFSATLTRVKNTS